MNLLRAASILLIGVAVVNAALIVAIIYWWVFAGEAPPFIQGTPLGDVALTLVVVGVVAGFVGAAIEDVI